MMGHDNQSLSLDASNCPIIDERVVIISVTQWVNYHDNAMSC